jgi:solute:Na+ symporter, SSS family
VVLFQFTLFLLVGVVLFVYHRDTGVVPPARLDRIYPQFVWGELPPGVAGLVIAAIVAAAMANLSAALNSLASTTVIDFYRPLARGRDDAHFLWWARVATVLWAAVLVVIGILARKWGSVLESGLSVASITLGLLLGVFLLGVLTRRVNETAAIFGVTGGLAVMIFVRFFTSIAFTWWVLIGTVSTYLIGCFSSLFTTAGEPE